MIFRLGFHSGLFLLCFFSQCNTVRQTNEPEKPAGSQYIRIDSLAPPLPLTLSSGDTNRDGLPDLLAGSSIYLNPGGDLAGNWKRINVGIDARSLVLANINNDGNPDLLALAPPDLYWLEALDPEGIQWASIKVATLPVSETSGLFYADSLDGWAVAGRNSLYLIQVPADPLEEGWTAVAQSLELDSNRQVTAISLDKDLDRDGDKDNVRITDIGVLQVLRNDQITKNLQHNN